MWEDFLPGGAIEVVTGVVVFLLGAGFRTAVSGIRNRVTDRPFRQTWNRIAAGERRTLYIVFSVVPTTDEYGKLTSVLTLPLATAMADLKVALERAYPRLALEVYSEDTFPHPKVGENIVLIGGPVHNRLSEDFIDRLDLPAEFNREHDSQLVHSVSGEVFRPIRGRKRGVIQDYGTVAIFPNPFNTASTVYLLAGCKAHGTNAAIRAMIKPCVADYHRTTGARLWSQVVICTRVRNDFISTPEIVRAYDAAPASLREDPAARDRSRLDEAEGDPIP